MQTVRTESSGNRVRLMRDSLIFGLGVGRPPSQISDDLVFGPAANKRFVEQLSVTESYLEYGSGASTIASSLSVPHLVTVESDPAFVARIEHRCRERGPSPSGWVRHFIYADVGRTQSWGIPIIRRPTRHRLRKWTAYPFAPWIALGMDFRADTILVDGRFRMACALAVVLMQQETEWTLLFDDYAERPDYWEFDAFAKRVGVHGRMAEFQPRENVTTSSVREALDRFIGDWR